MSSKAQRRGSDYRRKRKRFHVNQYTRNVSDTLAVDCISASAKKLCKENYLDKEDNAKINLASREVADDSAENAAKEEVSASGSNEICVSGDGTWKTRGHTSRIGVCSVIGDVTGKSD
ncbi:hypothetical protein TNCV_2891661 [Trichonephila clavipes]|nr:hypothetical protein TNCV_2891661 [Trichonephila clavipes]